MAHLFDVLAHRNRRYDTDQKVIANEARLSSGELSFGMTMISERVRVECRRHPGGRAPRFHRTRYVTSLNDFDAALMPGLPRHGPERPSAHSRGPAETACRRA
ncbi:protein of unknown function [Burkholderia multivorans]